MPDLLPLVSGPRRRECRPEGEQECESRSVVRPAIRAGACGLLQDLLFIHHRPVDRMIFCQLLRQESSIVDALMGSIGTEKSRCSGNLRLRP